MLIRSIVLSFLISFTVILVNTDSQHDEEVVNSFIKNKCLKNGGENAYDRLKTGAGELSDCLTDQLFTPTDKNETIYKICKEIRPAIYSCISELFNSLEPCLANEEKYIPDFVSSWYNSTLGVHCKDGGEKIIEHAENLQIIAKYSNCTKPTEKDWDNIFEKCFLKSTLLKDIEDVDFVIPKAGFCKYLEHGNQCFIDIVRRQCDEDLADFVKFHLKPTKIWCDKFVKNTANN